MLVLSRRVGERIWVGEHVCITLVRIDRGRVRVGIQTPPDVPVYREELLPLTDPRRRAAPPAAPAYYSTPTRDGGAA